VSDHKPIQLKCSLSLLNIVSSRPMDILSKSSVSKGTDKTNSFNIIANINKLYFDWDHRCCATYYENTRLELINLHSLLSDNSLSDLKLVRPDMFTVSGINTIYRNVVLSLLNCSLKCFPLKSSSKKQPRKWWWDSSVRKLKSNSIDAYNTWKISGVPRNGESFVVYHKIKKSYHKLIQEKKREHSNKIFDNLFNSLNQCKTSKFWKLWNANFKTKNSLENCTFECAKTPADIANILAEGFKEACSPNDPSFSLNKLHEFKNFSNKTNHTKPIITVDMVDKAIHKIDNNTASSHDNISIEHFKLAHPSIVVILAKLFTIFLDIGTVPADFCLGITTPIPKFKGFKKSVTPEHFRGITVNPIVSKIFEHCLLNVLECLVTSDRQFGFKKGVGCVNSIHTIRKTINFFNKCGNTVSLGFVDLSKAFDKTSVYGLLSMLQNKGINPSVINVLESWLSNSSTKVQWFGHLSEQVSLSAGVRQGGILSPLLFSSYVNILLDKLEQSGLGCFVNKKCDD